MSNDIRSVVRFVDDFEDTDPRTRNSCPGTVNGHKLIHIANQMQRRFGFLPKSVKHLIYQEEGTRNIWYKNSKCNAGVVAMGFSLSYLGKHPNSVPMEKYAFYFLGAERLRDKKNEAEIRKEWLARNNFVLVEE